MVRRTHWTFCDLLTLYFKNVSYFFCNRPSCCLSSSLLFTPDTSSFFTSAVLIGVDAVDLDGQCLYSVLMALCVTQTSATNFGIFIGFGNISMLIGNNIAPSVLGTVIILSPLPLQPLMIPCWITGYYLTRD